MNNLHLRRHFSCVSDFVLAKTLVIDVIIEETQKKIAFVQREAVLDGFLEGMGKIIFARYLKNKTRCIL